MRVEETRAEAQHWADQYEAMLMEKERTPLDPEIYQVVALFADRLTASQMMVCLSRRGGTLRAGQLHP